MTRPAEFRPVPLAEITIRRAAAIEDYRACQEVQRRAWGIQDEGYLIPIATMVGANLHGGLVLGAFLPDGSAAAMSFAFLGQIEGQPCLYSQLTGVAPEYQAQGLGHAMKSAQAQVAREQGLELIAWAFDPLQQGNAHFNLARLGATCQRYIKNMYGFRTDALNAQAPTDRLIAEWDLIRAGAPRVVPISRPRFLIDPVAIVCEPGPRLVESLVAIDVPHEIANLRIEQPAAAEAWQSAVAAAFGMAFSAGYVAFDFVRQRESEPHRAYYLLKRPEHE